MEPKVPDLYEFLAEAELQQYYNSLKNELKITNVTHLKYATDEDLRQVSGLSRPEIRRLRKFYEKYYPHGYLNKIRRLLQPPRKDEPCAGSPTASCVEPIKACPSPSKIPNNKHIIPPDAICVNKQLGTGEFGIVQQGVWTNGSERIQVAIKCLCRERMQSNPMEFLKEAAMMHSIEHENIVRLYGVVLDTESLMLVTELAHLRSLLECLKDPGLRVSFLTVPTLCEFAQQICNGMMYLETKRFIHRDLAARNILVFSKNKVKISDFGLSRALGVGKDYYQTNFNVNLKLPIAWCAPECINFLRFTHASDVWAYGVCLWEIFSYGFQPWAALTGHQILEAIDEPHYQRLEKPECCPKEYYSLMLKCWQHDATKRPRFNEIFQLLPDMKPEQLKTIVAQSESKKDYLMYRQGEIITVLEKCNSSPYWKGVLNSGKTGLFNPAFTVAYLDSLPSSVNRDSFSRTAERSSKRKIRTDMISGPQNDLKHTGHVGIDGVSFGDVAFLASPQNLPRQIVTPYKPSEDLEQTPLLLPPTPTSPDSIQTASGYFSETLQLTGHPSFINAGENHHRSNILDHNGTGPTGTNVVDGLPSVSAFDFRNSGFKDSNPFINVDAENGDLVGGGAAAATTSYNSTMGASGAAKSDGQSQHEYHEISDDDMATDKVFDQGPSLMDEMEHVFKSMSTISEQDGGQHPLGSPDGAENTNIRNELAELSSKLCRKNSSSTTTSSSTLGNSKAAGKSKSKKTSTVKPISVKDEKLLNQVIEMANEISAKSMTDLVSDSNQQTSSPKRKFSFRFPHIHNVVGGGGGGDGSGLRGSGTSNGGGGAHAGTHLQSHTSGLGSLHGGTGGGSSLHSMSRSLLQDKDHGSAQSSSSSSSAMMGQHHALSGNATLGGAYREKRNFSQEVNNVPDLQRYRSLTGIDESYPNSDIRIPLFDKESSDFCFKKSRELLSKHPFGSHLLSSGSAGDGSSPLGHTKGSPDVSSPGAGLVVIGNERRHRTLDKRTRDLIGENLLDIEKTLNALNLDFLQTYHELEKADSAETLFAECYSSMLGTSSASSTVSARQYQKSPPPAGGLIRNASIDSNSRISGALSEKGSGSGGSGSLTGKSPPKLAMGSRYGELNGSGLPSPKGLQQDGSHGGKYGIRDFKFRSFDARSKERSDYYNFKNEYLSELTRKQQNQVLQRQLGIATDSKQQQQQQTINQLYQIYSTPMQGRKFEDIGGIVPTTPSSAVRQRSLSFTENYELKPDVGLRVEQQQQQQQQQQQKQQQSHLMSAAGSTRNVITYKPKSIRARNLRRLSYNPINMVDSSSSSSESELDRQLAHSECDIRSRLHNSTNTTRRRRQYMNRKSNSNSASSQDKLYGSNASIKSAPQYNYHSDRRQYFNHYPAGPFHYTDDYAAIGDNDDDPESIYDFGLRQLAPSLGKKSSSTSTGVEATGVGAAIPPVPSSAPAQLTSGVGTPHAVSKYGAASSKESVAFSNKMLERDYLYSEFDVSKLTGKSPTTQSYFPASSNVAPQPTSQSTIVGTGTTTQPAGKTAAAVQMKKPQPQPAFQWPEKIHGALVKHNDMLWRQQSAAREQQPSVAAPQSTVGYGGATANERHFSSDTSSTETDSIDFRRTDCLPLMPPSPAPTITEEARIAYKSLVENPGSTTSGIVHIASSSGPSSASAGVGGFSSSTLPRAKLTNSLSFASASFRFKDIDCCSPPTEQAPKSPEIDLLDVTTDPDFEGTTTNPLRMLRSKQFPIMTRSMTTKGKLAMGQTEHQQHHSMAEEQQGGKADSPSYLTSPEYTYNNALVVPVGSEQQNVGKPSPIAMFVTPGESTSATEAGGNHNPIPLPPRDRNKTIPVNQKRHVRKYPLIIPATGVQRTLNRVTQTTPVDEKPSDDSHGRSPFLPSSSTGPSETNLIGGEAIIAERHQQQQQQQRAQDDDDDQATTSNLDVALHKSLESMKLTELNKDAGSEALTTSSTGPGTTDIVPKQHGASFAREFLENNFPNVTELDVEFKSRAYQAATTRGTTSPVGPPPTPATTTTTLPATIPAESAILTRRRTASDASGSHPRRQPPPPPPPPPLTSPPILLAPRDPTYENLDIFQTHSRHCVDTASLHCESILENDAEAFQPAVPMASIDTVDGFEVASLLFDSIQPHQPSQQPQQQQPSNSLDRSKPPAGGVTPVTETVEPTVAVKPHHTADGELIKSINFVSCEDLLEFAEKPKGRARGLESDEVRIMSKVLGKKPSPEQCLLTLEFIDWDIHKAIKLCKLQAILESYNLSLPECREALQTYDWDLHTTALKLKGGGK
ncbi:activated Cdc42 kinase-like [Anopheles aquasalis]|uniref:activated Cdc42 kinase-like n=1 Tax=Anopheles aquasalis TaxID=42839 RepID=UPI00215B219E|nr:activated Cdc42 kinase-like [Anopheles aquasalis]